ncbi:MAG: glycosyltransferase family 4 protein [Armatimonadetes bacterium]|nr:glycosyltransferase family 4 protein [Armatimonadota bacterium]
MVRVLSLRRQRLGGMATLSTALAAALEPHGVEMVVDDAADWIPDKTGFGVDRQVSKLVRDAAKGFDLVHAWGYRTAWACSEAFGLGFPWVYSAYDWPKTTSTQLIDRLNTARAGLCPTRATKNHLEDADTLNLELIDPGVAPKNFETTKEEARRKLDLPADRPLAAVIAKCDKDSGVEAAVAAIDELSRDRPDCGLVLAGVGPDAEVVQRHHDGERVWSLEGYVDVPMVLRAVDLLVVTKRRAAFSMVALEAMAVGTPVLLRRVGGLPDMGVEDLSVALFDRDEDLAGVIGGLFNAPHFLESLADSARTRAADWYGIDESAYRHARLYKEILR